MGLDITISEQTEFRTDSKGRPCHTVTELLNISGRYGHLLLDNISSLCELSNCSTKTIDAMDIFEGLEALREELAEYDVATTKAKYEETLNALAELKFRLCEKHNIPNEQILTKWGFLTEEELEQRNRLSDDEKTELHRAERKVCEHSQDLNEITDLENIIAELEQFNRDNNLSQKELTWGDRTFEVHIWY